MKGKITTILILVFSVALLVQIYLYVNAPKLLSEIVQSTQEDTQEQELMLATQDNQINFTLKILDKPELYKKAYLERSINTDELVIILKANNIPATEEQVLYEIAGTLRNLKAQEYRVTIKDSFDNLIDTKAISVEK